MKKHSMHKFIACGLLAFATQVAVASHDFRTCPSIAMLQAFDGDLVLVAPLSFDSQTHTMNTGILQKRRFSDDKTYILMMSPIAIHEGEDPEENAAKILGNLKADAETPFKFQIDAENTFLVCSYSQSGEEMKAMVFQLPDELDGLSFASSLSMLMR